MRFLLGMTGQPRRPPVRERTGGRLFHYPHGRAKRRTVQRAVRRPAKTVTFSDGHGVFFVAASGQFRMPSTDGHRSGNTRPEGLLEALPRVPDPLVTGGGFVWPGRGACAGCVRDAGGDHPDRGHQEGSTVPVEKQASEVDDRSCWHFRGDPQVRVALYRGALGAIRLISRADRQIRTLISSYRADQPPTSGRSACCPRSHRMNFPSAGACDSL